jgi:hypothetical protein
MLLVPATIDAVRWWEYRPTFRNGDPVEVETLITVSFKLPLKGILATITQSRSTNTLGYEVVIHNDGSASAKIGGTSFAHPSRSQEFPPGTIDTDTLRNLLTYVGDVSKIPTADCPKSASFGTRTQITYESKTSGDLQCIRKQASDGDKATMQASEYLGAFVQTTLGQLKINDRRIGANQ